MQHKHTWDWAGVTVVPPRRVAPAILVHFTCQCGGTYTHRIKPHTPNPTARTDYERWHAATAKRQAQKAKADHLQTITDSLNAAAIDGDQDFTIDDAAAWKQAPGQPAQRVGPWSIEDEPA